MGLNDTPSGTRIHIGFFGKRNAGKSSLLNAMTGQEMAVVSDTKGTTTDPVYKAMELLPLGPVMMIDTPGYDDSGKLGELRMKKTKQVLNKIDIAVLVVDETDLFDEFDYKMVRLLAEREIPYVVAFNKMDLSARKELIEKEMKEGKKERTERVAYVSALTGFGIQRLKEIIAHLGKKEERPFIKDLLCPLDLVVLVVPIDEAAPKGRLILPQQQAIREILDAGAVSVVVKDTELETALQTLGLKPHMVITDSQVFRKVADVVPEDIFLTSFSILMARKKGFLKTAVKGVRELEDIKDGDKILIAEGCTHHRQCGDIGTVKLPNMIRKFSGKEPEFVFCSGTEFPENLQEFKLVIHCGGCMLNEREMLWRMKATVSQEIAFTNYGTAMAYMNGILERSLAFLHEGHIACTDKGPVD